MKKTIALTLASALVFVLTTAKTSAETLVETEAATSIGASLDASVKAPSPANIREKLRVDSKLQGIRTNVRANEEIRSETLKDRVEMEKRLPGRLSASTSLQYNRENRADDDRSASSTERREKMANLTRNLAKVRLEIFEKQKKQFVNELSRALKNLDDVRGRIVSRIEKAEQSGRNMTSAKNALVTADLKLIAAKTAVQALINFNATATSTVAVSGNASTTASTTVSLTKPRELGNAAIKAVNEARRALNAVVVEIAHNMGLRVDKDGNITASSTATTSAVISQ